MFTDAHVFSVIILLNLLLQDNYDVYISFQARLIFLVPMFEEFARLKINNSKL